MAGYGSAKRECVECGQEFNSYDDAVKCNDCTKSRLQEKFPEVYDE